jgi:hypothetical protein
MPALDVSFVLSDPMIADSFDVTRRAEVIGETGRVTTQETHFKKRLGVVTPQDPADITRRDDGQVVSHAIEINSSFIFREASRGFQPDEITWRGRKYLVDRLYPFSHYGKGHQRILAVSVTATDKPQF